jgi:hypothetical protein
MQEIETLEEQCARLGLSSNNALLLLFLSDILEAPTLSVALMEHVAFHFQEYQDRKEWEAPQLSPIYEMMYQRSDKSPKSKVDRIRKSYGTPPEDHRKLASQFGSLHIDSSPKNASSSSNNRSPYSIPLPPPEGPQTVQELRRSVLDILDQLEQKLEFTFSEEMLDQYTTCPLPPHIPHAGNDMENSARHPR